jgi:hypothetical protein
MQTKLDKSKEKDYQYRVNLFETPKLNIILRKSTKPKRDKDSMLQNPDFINPNPSPLVKQLKDIKR